MIFNYNGSGQKSGIYKITNIFYNPPRIYIGQTYNFKRRWESGYKSLLPRNIGNRFLCNDYQKCLNELGHDDFLVFSIIEIMDNSTQIQRKIKEAEYIAVVYDNQNLCYNFQKESFGERKCWSKTPDETKKKISLMAIFIMFYTENENHIKVGNCYNFSIKF